MQKRKLKKLSNMQKNMGGELMLVEVMPGEKFIAHKMIKAVVVESSAYQVYGVHRKMQ